MSRKCSWSVASCIHVHFAEMVMIQRFCLASKEAWASVETFTPQEDVCLVYRAKEVRLLKQKHTRVSAKRLTPNEDQRTGIALLPHFHSFILTSFVIVPVLPSEDLCLNKRFRQGRGNLCNDEWIYTLSEIFQGGQRTSWLWRGKSENGNSGAIHVKPKGGF